MRISAPTLFDEREFCFLFGIGIGIGIDLLLRKR